MRRFLSLSLAAVSVALAAEECLVNGHWRVAAALGVVVVLVSVAIAVEP